MASSRAGRAIQAVVFDLDNTLYDFMGAKHQAIVAAVDAMIDAGLDLTPEEGYRRIFAIYADKGIEYQKVFNAFLQQELGAVEDRILAAAVVAYRRSRDGTLALYPHALSTLNLLAKQGYRLAVLSDAPRFEAWIRLYMLRLHHLFDLVLTFDDTGIRKPDPEPFRQVLSRLEVEPHQAVMVGDWPERDIAGAKLAGIHTVYARYGDKYPSKDRELRVGSGADFEIDDPAELLGVLARLDGVPEGEPR
jgi:HAD superfamily hydrolase (TIGR02253 family)